MTPQQTENQKKEKKASIHVGENVKINFLEEEGAKSLPFTCRRRRRSVGGDGDGDGDGDGLAS